MSNRMQKINHHLQKILSEIILLELNHPDLKRFFFTVSQVKCSADLKHANVFISVLGDRDMAAEGFKQLCRRLKVIQSMMAERIQMKYTPKLYLKLDDSLIQAERIQTLLNQVRPK